jgi:hypothetical protein
MTEFRTFRVYRDPGDTDSDVLGWGVQFPEAGCYIAWNREAYPEHQRFDDPHVSQYGNLEDVEQGIRGYIGEVQEVDAHA